MPSKSKPPDIPLPKGWDANVKSAILHMIALAQYALTYSRSWAADGVNQRVSLKAENDCHMLPILDGQRDGGSNPT